MKMYVFVSVRLSAEGSIYELPSGRADEVLMSIKIYERKIHEQEEAQLVNAKLFYAGGQLLSSLRGRARDWRPFSEIPCHALTWHRLHLLMFGHGDVLIRLEFQKMRPTMHLDSWCGKLDDGSVLKIRDGILTVTDPPSHRL